MFGRNKERESLFTPSDKSSAFLRTLLTPEVQEGPDKKSWYRYCEPCQEGKFHDSHLLFNKERNAWIDWSNDEFSITFKHGNYTERFDWFINTDGEEIEARLEIYDVVIEYDPPLFSKIGTLSIGEGKDRINLSLAKIDHHVFRLSREEIRKNKKYKYLTPLFEDPLSQRRTLERLLKEFGLSILG